MSGAYFYIKQGDLLPSLRATLLGPDDEPADLTGVEVRLRLARPDGTFFFDRVVTVESPPTAGVARYDWQAGDTDVEGAHLGEFRGIFDGKLLTFPNYQHMIVWISRRLP